MKLLNHDRCGVSDSAGPSRHFAAMKEFTIGLIAAVVVILSCTDSSDSLDSSGSSSGVSASESSGGSSTTRSRSSNWSSITYYADEMTGEQSFGAYSKAAGPTRSMEWPYNDVTAQVYFSCDAGKNNEGAWIRFSTSPNLIDDDIESGYNVINTRIRWDDKAAESATLTQQWGSEDLSFRYDQWAINRILAHNTMLLELNWYESGRVFFRFDLSGSTSAIEQARGKCRGA